MQGTLVALPCKLHYQKLMTWITRHTRLSLVVAAATFIVFVVGASVYANALVFDFFTNNGIATGLGAHVSVTQTLVRYDAAHYAHLARAGYTDISDAAFLPLYPLVMHLVVAFTHLSYDWAGLLVSWVALVEAAIVLYQWAAFELRERSVKLSPWMMMGIIAIFPTSFYLALPYTESLFILLSIGAILLYRTEHYAYAAVVAALASATRYQGLVLGAFFLADYILTTRNRTWKKFLPILGAGVGMLAYMMYLYFHFGSPFAFLTAEQSWHRLTGNPIVSLFESFRPIYLWFVAVLAIGLASVWKYLGKAYFAYCAIFIALPLSSGRFDSFNRYMLSMIPMFLALAILGSRKAPRLIRLAYVCSSVLLLAWSVMLFANGYWVA